MSSGARTSATPTQAVSVNPNEVRLTRWLIEDLLRCQKGQCCQLVITPSAAVHDEYLRDYGGVPGAVSRRSGHRGVFIRVTATVESNPDGRKILMGCTVTYTIGGCVLFDVGGYGKKIKMADVFHRYVEVWSNGFESHPRDYESYLIVYRDMSFINREARLRELMLEVDGDSFETLRVVNAGQSARIKHLQPRNRA